MFTLARNRGGLDPTEGRKRGGGFPQQPNRIRPRGNTLPRDLSLFGITITDQQRRVAYNTLIIASISLSCILALAGAYAGMKNEVGSDPWMIASPAIFSSCLIIFTYAWGGWLKHGESYGWAFFQPGRGGKQFVILQAATWFCVAISLVIPWMPWFVEELMAYNYRSINSPRHNGALLIVSSAIGVIGQLLTVISLFAFRRPSQRFTWRFLLTERADGKSFLYFFFSVQTGLAFYAVLVLLITEHLEDLLVGSAATLAFVWLIAVSTSLTHGVGGPWLRGEEGFTAFQPGRGGWRFVGMQFVGWFCFSLSIVIGIARSLCMLPMQLHPIICFFANDIIPDGAMPLGLLGLFAQIILTMSLFVFEESELQKANRYYRTKRKKEKDAWLSCYTGMPPEVKRLVFEYL